MTFDLPTSPCASSFDEEFKVLVKTTLNKPSWGVSPLDDDANEVRAPCETTLGPYYCSQPIEIDWNRRRAHSLDEMDARDMHLFSRMSLYDDEDDSTSDESDMASMYDPNDDDDSDSACIFALEL
ncbi:hypothetical protein AC1031_020864 [Aphanomyces cochlioides]|nr:hypothetical protein AC1031_020864 [Aphanomyces cochlioides]